MAKYRLNNLLQMHQFNKPYTQISKIGVPIDKAFNQLKQSEISICRALDPKGNYKEEHGHSFNWDVGSNRDSLPMPDILFAVK